jgi:hypothetical protein
VRGCDLFVFTLTGTSLRSMACKREYEYAAALGKPVLPVLVSDAVSPNLLPPGLAQIQLVDYRSRDRGAVLRLARAIASIPPSGPLPDPLPLPPEVPVSYLSSLAERVRKPVLSYEEQSALLLDLSRGLVDSDAEADARTLLRELRTRRDVYAAIAEEIDRSIAASNARPRQAHAARPAPTRPRASEPVGRRVAGRPDEPVTAARRWAALAGFVVGSSVGVPAMLSDEPNLWFIGFALGAAGAIAGAVCRLRPTALAAAMIGAGLGWAAVTGALASDPDRLSAGAIFGAGPGAILGAVLASSYLGRTAKRLDAR